MAFAGPVDIPPQRANRAICLAWEDAADLAANGQRAQLPGVGGVPDGHPAPRALQRPDRDQPPERRARAGGERTDSLRQEIREGMRFVFRDPYLRPMTLWAATVNFGATGYDALVVLFLVRVVHVGAGVIGLLFASSGVGAIAGSLAAGRVGIRFGTARGFLLAAFCTKPFMLLIPFTGRADRLAFFVAGSLVFAVGTAMSNVFVASFRQTYPSPGMRARVTATSWFVLNGVYPPGALLGGALGTWAGIRNGIWIMLGTMLLGSVFLLSRPLWRHRDLPRGAADPATGTCSS